MSTTLGRRTRTYSALAWSLQGLLAAAFLWFGVTKYAGGDDITASYEDIGAGQWLRYATGTTEILGGLALLVLPLAGLAATALTAQMVGAVATQVAVVEGGPWFTPLVLGLATLSVAWLRRDQSVRTVRRFHPHLFPTAR